MRRSWIQRAIHATYSTYSRSMAVLISKTVPCSVHQVITDPGGRYAIVVVDIHGHKMVLANVYVPPPFLVQVLYDLLGRLAPFMHLPLINAILNATLDSSNSKRAASVELEVWAETLLSQSCGDGKIPPRRASHIYLKHINPHPGLTWRLPMLPCCSWWG